MTKLTHVDEKGRARMVDVGDKTPQRRIARASGRIGLSPATIGQIEKNQMKKGDVLGTAQLAGIQAAKQTPQLIPLCHPLVLDKIGVDLKIDGEGVVAESEVHCHGRTGVEMEALTAVCAALLTVYDMCKAVDQNMEIGSIRLLSKEKHDVE
jgi:cyclic pyranopterin phosphate synthase